MPFSLIRGYNFKHEMKIILKFDVFLFLQIKILKKYRLEYFFSSSFRLTCFVSTASNIYLCILHFLFQHRNQNIKNTHTHTMSSEFDLRAIDLDVPTHPTTNSIRVETTNYGKILRTIAGINGASIPCIVICTVLDFIFTLITLIVGSTNLSACPIENRLPIYLVVVASVNLASICLACISIFLHVRDKDESISGFLCVTFSAIMIIIFQLFNFIWLICGTVWIFAVFDDVQYTAPNEKTYCHPNIYQYTLASIVLQYIIPFILCCCKNLSLMK